MKEKKYCYKIKRTYLKLENLKKFGFDKFIDESTEEIFWAKRILIDKDSTIGKFLKSQLEMIYLKGGEKYKKELLDSGYEFDQEGKLVLNQAFTSGLAAQLCVSLNNSDSDKGCLFINVDGMEWHETEILDESVFKDIEILKSNKVIYEKRIRNLD